GIPAPARRFVCAGAARNQAPHLRGLATACVRELDRAARACRRGGRASRGNSRVNGTTPFGRILRKVIESTPGLHGAVFTDSDGEPIDQYARGPAIEIQIAGAQWGLVLRELQVVFARMRAGALKSLYVECERAHMVVRAISSEYFVVLQASPDAHLGKAIAALERAAHE